MIGKAIRVLVVDDDKDQTELTGRYLRGSGFVVEVTNGAFGVSNLVRNFAPDVVLLDVEIPALSGDRLLTLARREAPLSTKFVLFSAWDEGRLRKLARESNAHGYVPKDRGLESLVQTLKRLCGHSAAAGGGEREPS